MVNASSLLHTTIKKGNITTKDVNNLFPHGNTIDRVVISGEGLFSLFLQSIAPHDKEMTLETRSEPHLHFQVSGMKINFLDNTSLRVDSIQTACKMVKECSPIIIKRWCPLNLTQNYTVALSSEFAETNGTDSGGIFSGLILEREIGDLDRDVFTNYIKECSPMNQVLSGRISSNASNDTRYVAMTILN